MAGIGFELRKTLQKGTFITDLSAYLYAAMLSSGPWLISIICLAVLGVYRGSGLGNMDHVLFRSTVIYAYAFSLILVGIVQLVSTRYLADRYYEDKASTTLSAFLTCTLLLLSTGSVLSIACYTFFHISLLHKLCAVLLFLVVSMIWLSMIFLSAIKDYNTIVYAFFGGCLLSIIAAVELGKYMQVEGYLIGYLLGQSLILFWIMARLLIEFPTSKLWDWNMIGYFKKFWDLALIGFFYNFGIWIDKFIFWMAPDGRTIVPFFRTHDLYEGPIFFSYLTIIPTLALFLLKIETTFYEHYRSYYSKVTGKMGLNSILEEKKLMVMALKENLREVLIFQGTITLLCIVFTPGLIKMAKLIPLQIPLFRICLVGSFLNVLLSINIIILFYFDLRKQVLAIVSCFLILNGSLSFFTLKLGFKFYGYGYCYATMLSLMLAYYLLNKSINDLEYLTFAKQPVHQ